jgi:hypothetical protein
MSVNASGTFRRTAGDEAADAEQLASNFNSEAWKDWPNEAGVSPNSISYNLAFVYNHTNYCLSSTASMSIEAL